MSGRHGHLPCEVQNAMSPSYDDTCVASAMGEATSTVFDLHSKTELSLQRKIAMVNRYEEGILLVYNLHNSKTG